MIKLTALKVRRMGYGLRQIDIVLGTGIHQSRYSQIENELVECSPQELELIENFFARNTEEKNAVGAPKGNLVGAQV